MGKHTGIWQQPELQALTGFAEDFIQILDCDFRHLYVNLAVAEAFGRTADEFRGKTMCEVGVADKVWSQWEPHLRRVILRGEPERFEFAGRLKDGHRILQSLVTPVKGPHGRVTALTAITRDVTEWKRTEALHEGQLRVMHELATGAPLGVLLATIVSLVQENAHRRCAIELAEDEGGHPPAPGDAKSRWTHPIESRDGQKLGQFVMYHKKPREPYPIERKVMAEAALVAAVVIQHSRTQDSLLETRDRFEVLGEYATHLVAVTDKDGVIEYASPSCEPLLGFKPDELVGVNLYLGVHRDDVPSAMEHYRRLRDEIGAQVRTRARYRHKDGGWRMLDVSAKSRLDHRGRYIAVVSGRDVTDSDAARRALEASQNRLDQALEASGLGLWEWEIESGRFHIDERCARNMGYEMDQIDPSWDTLLAILHSDDAMGVARATEAHLRGDVPHLEYEARVRTHAGTWTWVSSKGRAVRDAKGVPIRVIGTLESLDAKRSMEQRLAQADSQMQMLMESTDEGIVGLDRNGIVTFVNPAATRLLGLSADRLLDRDFDETVRHTSEDGTPLIGSDSLIVHCLLKGERHIGANELFWRDAERAITVEYTISPLLEEGHPAGAVLIFRDVGEKRRLARQLEHQALHDPLTGLANRRGFENRLSQLLQSARGDRREHALCYLDLDHFKLVNDTCGHAAGDELLRQLPKILGPLVRRGDSIARIGGDEFAVLLEDCPIDQAAGIAESLRDAVRDFRFSWQYRNFSIGASVGVVGITPASQGINAIVAAADAACYVAKDQGPNHVHVSYPRDLAISRRRGEMRWVARIKAALAEEQFRLHYMSIAPLDGHEPPRHHELLLRMLDGKGSLVMPSAFIQAAERYQLMPQIDRWVIGHAAKLIGESIAPDPGLRGHRFGINLSADSLRDPDLLPYIRETLRERAVPPSMVYFELTETAAIANVGAAVEFMRGLKSLGCQLALDDFGSGMSSFAYLKTLPVDFLKIDGAFIRDIVDNAVDQAIVRAVQAVCAQMGIVTIGEYVENEAIRDTLRGMGVNYGQGYAIAAPVTMDNFPVGRSLAGLHPEVARGG